ncbi:MAG: RNA 2',3'-cyclic phosphodiesterase [Thaumarchaeota archaeon]|nr:RNA 2',3'-cyclic phosphodiesterase [Nitrososphaerota archaeon]
MRTFIALDIRNDGVIDNVKGAQSLIHESGVDARYVDARSLHFTVRFLGETSDETIDRVKKVLMNVKARKVKVQYQGIGVFPGRHRINVVWLGVENHCKDELRSIADEVNRAIFSFGIQSRGTFQPHVTIARIKSSRNRDKLLSLIDEHIDQIFGEETLDSVRLKKSVLTPNGPIYDDLLSIRLGE